VSTIQIFDTTLRDGAQAPGAAMIPRATVRIAHMLEDLGVSVIEAGFPASSEQAFKNVQTVARKMRTTIVCALARTTASDIETAACALEAAHSPRIHTFIGTSHLHRTSKLNIGISELLDRVEKNVTHAARYSPVQFSAEDATRTELSVLVQVYTAAYAAGARVLNVPDTVGSAHPAAYSALIHALRSALPYTDIVWSVHCHDDLGLATANTLAGIDAGALQAECTINGIGERAGNAALEEVVMALQHTMPMHMHTIQTQHLGACSRAVARATHTPVPYNKAIVGKNAFAHESGIHQSGVLKDPRTYEILDPKEVGWPYSRIVLGRHSGKAAVIDTLHFHGIEIEKGCIAALMHTFKAYADTVRSVPSDVLVRLYRSLE
jgi:2-isopropylmalate synthase